MALKIQPTPVLTGKVAERILKVIEENNQNKIAISSEELQERKSNLNKVLKKAKI